MQSYDKTGRQCLEFILSRVLPGGMAAPEEKTVAQHLACAIEGGRLSMEASRVLAHAGLRIWAAPDTGAQYLAVANRHHPGLRALMQGSAWASINWPSMLRQIAGARAVPDRHCPISINGFRTRATLIPLAILAAGLAARSWDDDLVSPATPAPPRQPELDSKQSLFPRLIGFFSRRGRSRAVSRETVSR
ncbi:hypothetical protein [Parvibaculum sp.]|uniref:hypothetical protein n=1 Tax=Parvibaculum sp. TaxID=2024848 RepID=UPI00391BF735